MAATTVRARSERPRARRHPGQGRPGGAAPVVLVRHTTGVDESAARRRSEGAHARAVRSAPAAAIVPVPVDSVLDAAHGLSATRCRGRAEGGREHLFEDETVEGDVVGVDQLDL